MSNPEQPLRSRAMRVGVFVITFLLAAIGPSIITKYLGHPSSTSNFDQLANIGRIVVIVTSPIVLGWIAFTAVWRRRMRRLAEQASLRPPSS
ncbi:hypothetical protein [Burkholderia cepacia]|uniref:hypothetical protein n=1 Tax=Burkholderia cepacia TaxID=292 RepID=UPI0006688BBB|nr:hypothetical protein [Burkholderia cepacia]